MDAAIAIASLTKEQRKHLVRIRCNMVDRCHNPRHDRYSYYGARGTYVCREWRESHLAFLAWAATSGYKPGLEIDRRDCDGHYSPDNCRWVTHKQNSRNRRKFRGASSRFKGVTSHGAKWQAAIRVNGAAIHLGTFADEEEAARRYDRAALEHFGEFARLNFPVEPTNA